MSASDLANRLSRRLAQDIVAGALEGGSHVRAQQIADRYGVSRTPVRDALICLEKKGVLQHYPNRGYFVAEVLPRDAITEFTEEGEGRKDEYYQLAEDWMTDALPEIVTEQMLRERYELTRAKLNEVLARAAREGWAERTEGYGWRLLPVAKTGAAFDEIYRFRIAIEPAAMLEPGFTLNRDVLEEQQRIQEALLQIDVSQTAPESIVTKGAEFHEEIIKMSGNVFFVSALERVNRMRRLMEYRAKVDLVRVQAQSSEHLQIIDLLKRGEIVEASYFMRRHLAGAQTRKSPAAWSWSDGARLKRD
ncbi:GntR family transcriptional regulator [Salipiger sp. H15]|uniref:GntR family transcriptional regulator n=1 Tax=Alloyangia sp. H15 TaxID=3029062 RepID=A0AAU8AMS0_9RHOB